MVSGRRHARNWRAYLAGGGLVLAALLGRLSGHKLPDHVEQQRRAGNDTDGAVYSNINKGRAPTVKQEGWHPEERRHRGREWWYWRVTLALGVVTTGSAIAAAVFAGLAYIQVRIQANAAWQQVTEAHNTLLATTRPWIDFDKVEVSSITIDAQQISVKADFEYKIIGQSPALGVQVFPEVFTSNDERTSYQEGINQCRQTKKFRTVFGDAIFPGSPDGIVTASFGEPMTLVKAATAHFEAVWATTNLGLTPQTVKDLDPNLRLLERYVSFHLVACIGYKFYGSDEVHVTSFRGEITRRPDAKTNIIGGFDITKAASYAAPDIILIPNAFAKLAD